MRQRSTAQTSAFANGCRESEAPSKAKEASLQSDVRDELTIITCAAEIVRKLLEAQYPAQPLVADIQGASKRCARKVPSAKRLAKEAVPEPLRNMVAAREKLLLSQKQLHIYMAYLYDLSAQMTERVIELEREIRACSPSLLMY